MSDVFPADLLPEILIRVPAVEDLARLRCVCKAWRSVINDQRFLRLHMRQHDDNHYDKNLYVISKRRFTEEFHSISLLTTLNSSNSYAVECLGQPISRWINFKLLDDRSSWTLRSCDGMILIPGVNNNIYMHRILYNPFLREFHDLPPCPKHTRGPTDNTGFGYDNIHDDYKVVTVSCSLSCGVVVLTTLIYSLKSNKWRQLDQETNYPNCHDLFVLGYGVFLNGAIHWEAVKLEKGHSMRIILALNLSSENYFQLPFPSGNLSSSIHYLDALGGELFISSTTGSGGLEVWIMKDYGGNNTWTKFMSFDHHLQVLDYEYPKLMAYVKGKQKVLIMCKYSHEGNHKYKAIWFDLVKKCTMTEVPLDSLPGAIISNAVSPSLIHLDAIQEPVPKRKRLRY